MAREGLRITLKGLGGGWTVDAKGKQLLPHPFVFQCPPLDQFKVTHQYTMGNYDTVDDGQFTRRGSKQLRVWQFDTLVMEVARSESGRQAPGWIPFAKFDRPGVPTAIQWYVDQLVKLHDAGAPFRMVAQNISPRHTAFREASANLGPIISTPAVLLGFSQTHKHGEGDAIYLEGVSFSEWRDPTASQRGLGKGHGQPADSPPTTVLLMRDGVCVNKRGHKIPRQPPGQTKKTTLAELSKFYYHTPEHWRKIANANNLHGGAANTELVKFVKYKKIPRGGAKVKIPALPRERVTDPTLVAV